MALSLQAIKKRTAPWVGWLMALLVLFPMGQHAAGAVLCIETDGTVAVETATGLSCGSSAPIFSVDRHEADSVSPASTQPASHCGACIDIMLPGGADEDCASFVEARGLSAQVDLPPVALVPHVPLFSDAEATSVRHDAADDACALYSSLTPLRSVVLLI